MTTASSSPKKSGDMRMPTMDQAIRFVIDKDATLAVTSIGNLSLPKDCDEAVRCNDVRNILQEYSGRSGVKPLSIAVFGPPGSGKSHCVREIVKSVGGFRAPVLVNLSQLSDPKDLAAVFQKELSPQKEEAGAGTPEKNGTRVFFFDEFDAPLKGVSLGWLRWFLAPIQDGEFFFDGQSIEIGKAVFMFAGGTAASLDEFQKRALTDPVDYRNKKVPDFISRLRGFIDIQGINNIDDEREVRRALVLRYLLDRRWPVLRKGKEPFPIDEGHVRSLLSNVHFVHGVRSLEALLDMSHLDGDGSVQFPRNDLRKLHLSRGPLDGKVIGISAGQSDANVRALLTGLTEALLRNGATLAYGGDFIPAGTLEQMVNAAKGVPDELVDRDDKRRIRNYLAFPSFCNSDIAQQYSKHEADVEFLRLETLSSSELSELEVPDDEWFRAHPGEHGEPYKIKSHMAWSISLFRMRVRLIQDVHALVVMGGKDDGRSWGRFSGVAEEVMLAVAFGKPVYVLGRFQGAAHAVGRLLGLDQTVINPDSCLLDQQSAGPGLAAEKYANSFAIPGRSDLPLTIGQLRDFLFQRSMATPAWPWNGLSHRENRELFSAAPLLEDPVQLIVRGLLRLDWKSH